MGDYEGAPTLDNNAKAGKLKDISFSSAASSFPHFLHCKGHPLYPSSSHRCRFEETRQALLLVTYKPGYALNLAIIMMFIFVLSYVQKVDE